MPPLAIGLLVGIAALWLFSGSSGASVVCEPLPDRYLPIAGSPYSKPLESYTLTQPFGGMFRGIPHKGADLAAPTGTPIYSVGAGRVVKVTVAGTPDGAGNGNAVAVLGADGIVWSYLHMSARSSAIVVGTVVHRGEFLGRVGMTGDATGPHLHLQASVNGNAVDPMAVLGLAARGVV